MPGLLHGGVGRAALARLASDDRGDACVPRQGAALRSARGEQLGQAVGFMLLSRGPPRGLPRGPASRPGKRAGFALVGNGGKLGREKVPSLHAHHGGRRTGAGGRPRRRRVDRRRRDNARALGVPGARFLIDRDEVWAHQAGMRGLPATRVYYRAGTLCWIAPTSASTGDVGAAGLPRSGDAAESPAR